MSHSIDYVSSPFDVSKLSFSAHKTLDMGGVVVNIKYGGKDVRLKSPFMQSPYGISKPYSARSKKDSDDAGAAVASDDKKTESNKCSIDLTIEETDEKAMALEKFLSDLDDAVYKHIMTNAEEIYKHGLKLNKEKLKDKMKEVKV